MDSLQIGHKIIANNKRAIIRYIGETQLGEGVWLGIEFSENVGKTDGTINGIRYFTCPPKHGLFVKQNHFTISRQKKLKKSQNPEQLKSRISKSKKELVRSPFFFKIRNKEIREKLRNHVFKFEQINYERICYQNYAENLQKTINNNKFDENIFDNNKKKGFEEKINQSKEELSGIMKENQKLREEISTLSKEIEQRNVTSFKSKIRRLTNKLKEMKKLNEEEKKKQEDLEKQKKKIQEEIQDINEQIHKETTELNQKLKMRIEEIYKIEQSRNQLLSKYSEIDEETSEEELKKLEDKIERYEEELQKSRKVALQFEMNKTKHEIYMEKIISPEDDISRTGWTSTVMKRHPEIIDLIERLKPLYRAISFARNYSGVKSEVRSQITRDITIQLIMQHFDHEGRQEIQQFIEENTKTPYTEHQIEDSRLFTLLKDCLRNTETIWELSMEPVENEEQLKERIIMIEEHASSMGLEFLMKNDISIWDEPSDNSSNILFENPQNLKEHQTSFLDKLVAANINKLIEKLTEETDTKFLQAFLMTYQSFMRPEHFLFKLKQRYSVPVRKMDQGEQEYEEKKKYVQLKVIAVIQTWLDKYFEDFDAKLLLNVENMISKIISQDHPAIVQKVNTMISKKKENKEKELLMTGKLEEPKLPRNIFKGNLSLSDIDEEEFARQLTLVIFQTFSKIQPSELVTKAWSKENQKHKAPNVTAMIARFNSVVGYVSSEIVMTKTIRHRVKKIVRFIRIGEYLLKMHNFDGLMAIIAALSTSSVSRLKFTKEEVPKNYIKSLDEMRQLLSSENGYKKYRDTLKEISTSCIPYLGVYLTDITFISDGSPNEIDGLINFAKRKLLYLTIKDMQNFQMKPFNFFFIHQIAVLFDQETSAKTEKELYKISLEREPRSATRQQII